MKIGKIKENAQNSWNLLAGISIAFIKDDKECLAIRPIKFDEMEKFYKTLHDEFGKVDFFENYDEFVCYAANKECDDIILTFQESDIEDVRDITADEIKEHNSNLEKLINNHSMVKIGAKEYKKQPKMILIQRNENFKKHVCRECGSHDIEEYPAGNYSIDLPYCCNCGKIVFDLNQKYCGFCGIEFEKGEVDK